MPNPVGKPRKFKTDKAFWDKFQEYVAVCKDRDDLPNIAGFCVFADISRPTFYELEDKYPYTYKKVMQELENAVINNKWMRDTFKIFYMKNKFGSDYRDRQEVKVEGKLSLEDLLDEGNQTEY